MATYDGECQQCGTIQEYHCAVSDRHDQGCAACGGQLKLIILQAPKGFVKGKFEAFKSVVDGSIVSSQRTMDEHNKRNGVVCLADGYDEEQILAGNLGKPLPKTPEQIKKEIATDIVESIQQVQSGYKPQIGEADE